MIWAWVFVWVVGACAIVYGSALALLRGTRYGIAATVLILGGVALLVISAVIGDRVNGRQQRHMFGAVTPVVAPAAARPAANG